MMTTTTHVFISNMLNLFIPNRIIKRNHHIDYLYLSIRHHIFLFFHRLDLININK